MPFGITRLHVPPKQAQQCAAVGRAKASRWADGRLCSRQLRVARAPPVICAAWRGLRAPIWLLCCGRCCAMRRCRAARPTCCGRPSRRRSRRRCSGGAPLVRTILLVVSRILLVVSSPGRRPIGEWRATEPPRPARPSAANSKTAFQPRSRARPSGVMPSPISLRAAWGSRCGGACAHCCTFVRDVGMPGRAWYAARGAAAQARRAGAARRTADTETYSRDTDRGVRITRLMVGITIDEYE